jgi:putative Ca2+/H+ antiporter (TMEM165/GDT1 family)
MNIWPFMISFFMITMAELGDKTQLLALGFATKYPVIKVLGAVSLATSILMALAVLLGGAINRIIPEYYLQLFIGIIFIFFGVWTIFGKEKVEDNAKAGRNPFWIVFSAFFLAELGDKTQLATFALTAEYGKPFQVWFGATLGMIGVNAVAVLFGSWIKRYLTDEHIKWIGAAVFIIFGIWTLVSLIIE